MTSHPVSNSKDESAGACGGGGPRSPVTQHRAPPSTCGLRSVLEGSRAVMVLCPPNQYTRGGRESVSGPPGPRAQVAVALRNRVPPDCLAPLSRGARGSAWAVPEAGYCFCPLPPFPCLPNPAPGCWRAACSLQPPSSGPGGAALKRSALWPLEALRAPGWSRLPSCPQRSSLPRSWLPALRNSASFSGQSAETGKTFPGHSSAL